MSKLDSNYLRRLNAVGVTESTLDEFVKFTSGSRDPKVLGAERAKWAEQAALVRDEPDLIEQHRQRIRELMKGKLQTMGSDTSEVG